MRIKYDAEIADIFKSFTETLCNIRERNTRNVEQTRKDYEDQLHEAIVAVQAAGHEISSSSNWEDIIFSPKEELLVSHDLNIALARDRMTQINDSLTAQQNAMFIYATGMFEKFISDIVHVAVRKSSSAKKLYQDKFIDFANNYYKRFNSEAHQKEIGDTAKMLNSYHDMIAVEGGFLSIVLYMFDNDKQLVKNQYFKTNLDLYKENKERRNLLIHRGSIADRQYYQGLKRARINQWEKLLSERVFVPMGLNESKYWLDFQWDPHFYYYGSTAAIEKIITSEQYQSGELIPIEIIQKEPSFNLDVNPQYLDKSLRTLIELAGEIFIYGFRPSTTSKNQIPFIVNTISNISQNYSLPNTGNNFGIRGYQDFRGELDAAERGIVFDVEDFKLMNQIGNDVTEEEIHDTLDEYSHYSWYDYIIVKLIETEMECQHREGTFAQITENIVKTDPTMHLLACSSSNFLLMWQQYMKRADYVLKKGTESPLKNPDLLHHLEFHLQVIEASSPTLYQIVSAQLLGDDKVIEEFIQSMSNEDLAVNSDLISPNGEHFWTGVNLTTLYKSPIFRLYRDNQKIQQFFESP
ncbi:MAG: hypothetical protein ACJ0KI_04700, partial [Dehalococcoidia bacterium]